MEEVPEDISGRHFLSFENTFFRKFSSLIWPRKLPIVFKLIIIQNYVQWVICTGVTFNLHCSEPIQSESSKLFMYIINFIIKGIKSVIICDLALVFNVDMTED